MHAGSQSEIAPHREADVQELHNLCHSYAERAGVDFTDLASLDFYHRLTCACANRWGLVIELLIEAFLISIDTGDSKATFPHFCAAFTRRTGLRQGHSPFSIDDYEKLFEANKIFEILEKKRSTIRS